MKTFINILRLLLVIVIMQSCADEEEKETIGNYTILLDTGGWGGGDITDEYKLKDGYYIYVSKASGDSVMLKQSAVLCIKKHNNTERNNK